MATPVQFPRVGSIQGPLSRELPLAPEPKETGRPNDFDRLLSRAIETVDSRMKAADATIGDFLEGKTGIHEMALSLEKADLSLRLLTRIRNRVIDAYREVSRMNV